MSRPPYEEPPANDWTERWGRRIGRSLAVLVALTLAYYLFTTYLR